MTSTKQNRILLISLASLVLVVLVILFIGRYPKPFWMSPALLFEDQLALKLVLQIRLPRIITALLLGMTLAAAGQALQMIFRNPLVEPGFLGVTQGAAFGAALAILTISSSPLLIETSAAIFGLIGLGLSYTLANRLRFGGWTLRLILAGIAVSAAFSSGLGILKYLADPLTELPDITFWLLGGLWSITWQDLWFVLPFVIPGLLAAWLMRWRINLLSLNDAAAVSLGANPRRERLLILVLLVAAVSAVTAVGGIVSWVGLIVPHISRRLVGISGQYSIPASMLMGGIFTVICDTMARSLIAGEIPLGILTSLFGALLFMWIMLQGRLEVRK